MVHLKALAGVIGGPVALVGLVSLGVCLCRRHRRRMQHRRAAGEAQRGRRIVASQDQQLHADQVQDLEFGRRGRVVGQVDSPLPPSTDGDDVDTEQGRRGRVVGQVDSPPPPPRPSPDNDDKEQDVRRRGRAMVRRASPPRRSQSAPPDLALRVHAAPGQATGDLTALPSSSQAPHHVLDAAVPASPAGSFIDLLFDEDGEGRWNRAAAPEHGARIAGEE